MKFMRSETVDEYGIKTLQDKILQIAVYIDSVCEEIGAKYYLMGGSALGALRHGGFIPWDDDLDIFMFPKDYEKFKDYFSKSGDKENYYLQQLCESDGRVLSAKLRLNNSTYIEEATKDWKIHQGIFVDIFLLHGTPSSSIKSFAQCLFSKLLLAKGQSEKQLNYTGIKKAAVLAAKMLPLKLCKKLCFKKLYKYDCKETRKVCHFVGKAFFKKGVYDRELFGNPQKVMFETALLCIPEKADNYLKDRFGDYMKLPPKESIKTVQHALIWDTERDFSHYSNAERDFSDEARLV